MPADFFNQLTFGHDTLTFDESLNASRKRTPWRFQCADVFPSDRDRQMLERQDVMPEVQPSSKTDTPDANRVGDPLAGLYHMSNTAGVSTQDYVAINVTAIAALLLGFASVLVVLSNILLVVPFVGIICGIVAIVQIRHSNQTQTGMGLAFFGLALSLLLGVGTVAYEGVNALRVTSDEKQIAKLVHEFGHDVVAEKYDQAYQLTGERFRERVPLAAFTQTLKSMRQIQGLGVLRSIEWNEHRMEIDQKPDASASYAYAMTLFAHSANPYPQRMVISFEKPSGGVVH